MIERPSDPRAVGTVHTARVEKLDGPAALARTEEGLALRVPFGVPGDLVRVRVTARGRKDTWTTLLEVIEPGSGRVEPPCSIALRCGTCPWQTVKYGDQLTAKGRMLRELVGKHPELADVPVHDPIGIKPPVGYRTKIQMPVGGHKHSILLGFYAPRSHAFVAARECPVQHEAGERVRTEVVRILNRHEVVPYEENTRTGVLRSVLVRVAEGTGQVGVVLVVRSLEAIDWAMMAAELTAIPELTGVWVNENDTTTNAVLGPKTVHLGGARRLTDEVAGVRLLRTPTSFFQTNHRATERLVEIVRDGLPGGRVLVDLYAGGGLFAATLAERFEQIHLIESNPDAVTAASATLKALGVKHAHMHPGTAEERLPGLLAQTGPVDALVADPPRAGMSAAALEAVRALRPARIAYVSCRPTALVRDLKALSSDYEITSIRSVDMFPHTPHVEAVGLLSLKETGTLRAP